MRHIGPCLCGDPYCHSCGPAQGNYCCPACGEWSLDGGCADREKCDKILEEMEAEEAKWEEEAKKYEEEWNRREL